MAVMTQCPDSDLLRKLLLGLVPEEGSEELEQHVRNCCCGRLIPTLPLQDALTTAVRNGREAAIPVEEREVVETLIERMHQLTRLTTSTFDRTAGTSSGGKRDRRREDENLFSVLAPPQGADEIGRLGTYRVLKVLGRGGMGIVFLAEDTQLQRTVALKVMLPHAARMKSARERFLLESRAAARTESEYIVTIFQVGEDRGVPYLAMQVLRGESLQSYLQRHQTADAYVRPPWERILKIGREVAEGLASAHEKGLIHRDIKPANIWLDETAGGRVKLIDFGLARDLEGDGNLTRAGTVVGSVAYMAPEQAQPGSINGRADLFSLGCVLYQLCTGRVPWKGHDISSSLVSKARDIPTPIEQLAPGIPPRFATLIARLMARLPQDRPATARAVADEIRAIEQELQMPNVEPAAPMALMPEPAFTDVWQDATGEKKAPLRRKTPPRQSGLRLAVLLAVMTVGAWFLYKQHDKGTLKLEGTDDDVQVVVEQNGKKVEVLNRFTGMNVELPPGEYQLRLDPDRKDIRLDRDSVRIKRGGLEMVVCKKVLPPPASRQSDRRPAPRTPVERPPRVTSPPTAEAMSTGTGLTGRYFADMTLNKLVLTRTDPTINFDWGAGSPGPRVPADNFSCRWTGQVVPKFTETYTFTTVSNDGVRLWVNGKLLIDNWTNHIAKEDRGSIALVAGQKYDLKMEHYELVGTAVAKLFWSSPSTPKQVVPASQLYPSSPLPGPTPATSPASKDQ